MSENNDMRDAIDLLAMGSILVFFISGVIDILKYTGIINLIARLIPDPKPKDGRPNFDHLTDRQRDFMNYMWDHKND